MTTSVSFNDVDLKSPSPVRPRVTGDCGFEITFDCMTDDYDDIQDLIDFGGITNRFTLLSGKTVIQTTGTIGDLDIGGDTYENCAIMGPIQVNEIPGTGGIWWKYRVSFAQDTSL
jgi:hypothetical protein